MARATGVKGGYFDVRYQEKPSPYAFRPRSSAIGCECSAQKLPAHDYAMRCEFDAMLARFSLVPTWFKLVLERSQPNPSSSDGHAQSPYRPVSSPGSTITNSISNSPIGSPIGTPELVSSHLTTASKTKQRDEDWRHWDEEWSWEGEGQDEDLEELYRSLLY